MRPVPWEVARAPGLEVASNGDLQLHARGGARIFLRRAIKGLAVGAGPGDKVLPKLNELAGELLRNMSMPGDELARRLEAIKGLAHVTPPEHVEMAVAELDGVRAYVTGRTVILTREDLNP
jgi:hypothetical protein